jgi:hypothetical protein
LELAHCSIGLGPELAIDARSVKAKGPKELLELDDRGPRRARLETTRSGNG